MKGASLELRELTKSFGSVQAVDDLSLSIHRGEFLTLLGPSGCGKTTTLMMIAGFTIPNRGHIFIEKEDVTLLPPYKRDVGMVFQNYALFPHMTIFKNIAFPLKIRRISAKVIQRSVEEALSLVRLSGLGDRYPSQLSGGQQQRVALARALVFEPRVLLMDEPLGALDKKLREQMQMEIKHLQKKLSMTVIYVTHDQGEALTMSDRIAVMNGGRIEQLGSPKLLYESPANRFVADFIGESNFLKGKVVEVGSDSLYVLIEGQAKIRIPLREGTAEGQEVDLTIRPERLQIAATAAHLTESMEAFVDEVVYVGEMTKYMLRVGNGQFLTLKQSNRAREIPLRAGERVRVGWDFGDMHVV